MQGMGDTQEQEPVELQLGAEAEGFLPLLPPENIRIHSKLNRLRQPIMQTQMNFSS
jgi:hypothetical protein